MRRFDYSFLSNGMLPADLIGLTAAIGELKVEANHRKNDNPNIFTRLESIAKIQSVKGSNEIEGIMTTDKRIKEIVNGNSAPLNHDEEEIAGYRDALSLIHTAHDTLQLRENDLLRLHAILLQYTGNRYGGRYKLDDNVIMETDKFGNRRVRFEPVSAEETPHCMEQMLLAYMEAKRDSKINSLLLIPCVIVDFLCIHPFDDGNGRMSRLLSLLLLYKNGYDAGKYISFEEQINKKKGMYYEALRQSSIGWHENKNDYMPFVRNFITTLLMCYKELDQRFAVIKGKKVNKQNRVEAVILDSLLPISKSEISNILPDVSVATIEKVLTELLSQNKIIKIGTYKNAKYLRNQ